MIYSEGSREICADNTPEIENQSNVRCVSQHSQEELLETGGGNSLRLNGSVTSSGRFF